MNVAPTADPTSGIIALFGPGALLLAQSSRGDGRHLVVRAHAKGGATGRWHVFKLFGRKRSFLRESLRDFGQRVLVGKTGVRAERRARIEQEVLELWRREGFDVPRVEENVALPPGVAPPVVVMEFVSGRPLDQALADPGVALAEKERLLEWLGREWARRHARAKELREPKLIQVHASLDHVIHHTGHDSARGERLVTFDFEVAWTRRHPIARLAKWERDREDESLQRCAPPQQLAALRAALERGYAGRG
jgi:hypothetical protein